jgi:hypothetical protein
MPPERIARNMHRRNENGLPSLPDVCPHCNSHRGGYWCRITGPCRIGRIRLSHRVITKPRRATTFRTPKRDLRMGRPPRSAKMATTRIANTHTQVAHATATAALHKCWRRRGSRGAIAISMRAERRRSRRAVRWPGQAPRRAETAGTQRTRGTGVWRLGE